MAYINVGASYAHGGRIQTKKALREELLSGNPVVFDSTSPLGPRNNEEIMSTDIGEDTLSVIGPDPFTNRKWYATVTVFCGKFVVK